MAILAVATGCICTKAVFPNPIAPREKCGSWRKRVCHAFLQGVFSSFVCLACCNFVQPPLREFGIRNIGDLVIVLYVWGIDKEGIRHRNRPGWMSESDIMTSCLAGANMDNRDATEWFAAKLPNFEKYCYLCLCKTD